MCPKPSLQETELSGVIAWLVECVIVLLTQLVPPVEQVTVVTPMGKNEPDAGLQTGACGGQLSVTVGAG